MRSTTVALAGLLLAAPALSSAGNLDLRIGGFFPRADSNLFTDDADLYTVSKKDWRGVTGGAEYSVRLADHVELGVHLDGYERTIDTQYRRYDRQSGRAIEQTLRLDVVPVGLTLRLVGTRRKDRIAPYVGVGADLLIWKYEEFGDFVDFESPGLDIYSEHFRSEGVTPGLHATAGLRVPFADDFAIVGEGRYQWGRATMGDDFAPREPGLENKLDLSGASFTLGVQVRF